MPLTVHDPILLPGPGACTVIQVSIPAIIPVSPRRACGGPGPAREANELGLAETRVCGTVAMCYS